MKLEYIDKRPFIFNLEAGRKFGVSGKSKNKILDVSDKEGRRLLAMRNGNNPIWKEIKIERGRKLDDKKENVVDETAKE